MLQASRSGGTEPVIGGSQVRVDAVEKVTGAACYAEDIKMPGLLHAALVRSPHPHARVLKVDAAGAEQMPGVVRILTAGDIPGENSLEGYSRNEHLLARPRGTVRMVGDAVALVVAESPANARAAVEAVQVDYEPLSHTYDAVEAMEPGATSLYDHGNVLNREEIHHGEAGAALSTSDTVLNTCYRTPFMEHSALERETALGYIDEDGRVTVVAGHQQPHWAQGWIANLLALPPERVRVITPPIGGAFGGKQDPWPLMAAALAAYHLHQPVRLAYTRRESFDVTPKRHPYYMDFQVAAKADGTLNYLNVRIVANTGAYDCDGYHIPRYAMVASAGPYRWRAVDAEAWAVYTNGPKAGQMRGFGTPQAAFALECTLDELSVKLGLDPLELRMRNAIDDETITLLGHPVAETLGYRKCLEAIEPRYREAQATMEELNDLRRGTPWRRGVGLAGMWYRFGKSGRITCEAEAELGRDGATVFYFSAPDYGQGTTTVMAQLAAEAMELPREAICVVNGDTALTPDSGIQGASRSTYWVGGAVTQAGKLLKDQILRVASEMLDCHADALSLESTAVRAEGGGSIPLGDVAREAERMGLSLRVKGVFAPVASPDFREDGHPHYLRYFMAGAHLAEVDVHMQTGEVDVARVVAVHDIGRTVNLQGAQGQVEGAVLMGLGAALMEEYRPEVTAGFSDYYLPTICSAPEIEVILVTVPSRWGPLGVKGLGEGAILPTPPAILNGIHSATGARVRELPATAERVLWAIRHAEGRDSGN